MSSRLCRDASGMSAEHFGGWRFCLPCFLHPMAFLSVFHHGFYGLNGLHGKGIRVMGLELPLISLSTLILEEGMNSPPTPRINPQPKRRRMAPDSRWQAR